MLLNLAVLKKINDNVDWLYQILLWATTKKNSTSAYIVECCSQRCEPKRESYFLGIAAVVPLVFSLLCASSNAWFVLLFAQSNGLPGPSFNGKHVLWWANVVFPYVLITLMLLFKVIGNQERVEQVIDIFGCEWKPKECTNKIGDMRINDAESGTDDTLNGAFLPQITAKDQQPIGNNGYEKLPQEIFAQKAFCFPGYGRNNADGPSPHEVGLTYGDNNADIAADNMVAHIVACESKPKEGTRNSDEMLSNAESRRDDTFSSAFMPPIDRNTKKAKFAVDVFISAFSLLVGMANIAAMVMKFVLTPKEMYLIALYIGIPVLRGLRTDSKGFLCKILKSLPLGPVVGLHEACHKRLIAFIYETAHRPTSASAILFYVTVAIHMGATAVTVVEPKWADSIIFWISAAFSLFYVLAVGVEIWVHASTPGHVPN